MARRSKTGIAGGKREPKLGTEWKLKGIHRESESVPGIPLGEMAARIDVRPGALKSLVESGELEAIDNGSGGYFFNNVQEAAAVALCYERGLVRTD